MQDDETRNISPDEISLGIQESKVINNRYRIGKKLGGGGMGNVFLATDLKLEREVALKTIKLAAVTYPEKLEELKLYIPVVENNAE